MFTFKVGETIYDLPEDKVKEFKDTFPDAVEVVEEEEGKTNGVAEEGATVTPKTGQAPETTESDSVNTSSESRDPFDPSKNPSWAQEDIVIDLGGVNDVREIDNRIASIAGTDGKITPLDSPKRIFQYNELTKRRNQILQEGISATDDLLEFDDKAFDPNVPAPDSRSYVKDGTAYLAGVPLVVDGELVGTQAEGIPLDEVVVTANKLSKEELSEKYNSFEKNIANDVIDFLAVNRGVLEGIPGIGSSDLDVIQKLSEGQQDRREQYNALYADNKIDINFTRSLYNTMSNSLTTIANVDDQFEYLWHFLGTQNVSPELQKKNLKKLEQARLNLNKKDSYYLPTQRFDRLKEKDGVFEYALGGLAGVIDGAMAVVTTGAQQPPGLFINLFANALNESIDIQAEKQGLTPSELVESGNFTMTPAVVSTALELGSEWTRFEVITKYFNRLPMAAQQKYAATLEVMGKNGAQEMFQYTTQQFNQYASQGMNYRDAVIKATGDFFTPEAFESGLKGAFGSGGVILTGDYLKASNAIKTPQEHKRIQGLLSELYQLDKAKYSKNITAAQLKAINTAQVEIREKLTAAVDANDDLMGTLSDQQIEIVNQNYDILTSVNAEIDATKAADNLTDDQKASIIDGLETAQSQAAQEIFNIRNTAEEFYGKLAKVKKEAEDVDQLDFEIFNSTTEVEDFLNKKKDPRINVKESASEQGFFIPGVDGKPNTIVINKEVALNEQAVNVAAHEFLHYILYETLKNNPVASINLGNALLDELNKIDVDQIKDSNFKKRMELYKDEKIEVQMEEALTLFSDALATGDIKFDESISTKIGDKVRRALQKNFGVKVKFNKGKDVYNFIKDYNNSLEKGGITTAQRAVAEEGAEGELIPQAEQQADEQIVKKSKGIYQEVETFKDDLVNEQSKDATAFLIADKLQNEVDRRLKIDVDPETREDIVRNFLFDDRRGLLGLLKNYSPARNESIMGYLNSTTPGGKLLDARLIEFYQDDPRYNQIIQSTTDEVVQRKTERVTSEDITETTTEDVTDKPLAKKPTETIVYSDEILGNVGAANTEALETRITEEIQTAFKGKDVSRFKELKDIPKNITQLYADMFGLSTVDGIVDFKRNFPKLDEDAVRKIRTFLSRNAEDDFRRFPKTKDDKKRATGVKQTKLGKVMYDANDNLVGTLKQYKDILQGKNITLPAYDGTMVEFNRLDKSGKKLPLYRDSQHYKAALKFHIQNRIAEDVMPDKAQRLSAGLKFSKSEAKPIDQQNLQEVLSIDIKMSKSTQRQKDEIVDKGPELLEAFQNEPVKTTAKFRPVLREMLSENFSDEDIQNVTPAIVKSFVKYEKYKDQLSNTSVGKVSVEEIEQQELGTNLIKLLNLKEFINNFGQAFSDNYLIQKQRDLFAGFATQKIKSPEDLITILKIYRGHQTSAGKIGGGRNQIFENNKDFIDELNKIDKVLIETAPTKSGVQITSVSYDNKPIKDFKRKIKQVQQKSYKTVNGKRVVKSKEDFKKEFDLRQEEALRNWNELIDYLQYMRDNGTKLDFAMTMMSLKSNMSSMLKAAAPVAYYYVGPQFNVVTYEHLIPTEAIVLKLTDHFYGKKIDLESLRKKYNVAIIPEIMDSNINIQRQKSLPAYWDESMSETLRYYDDLTLGLKNMYAIESLEDGVIYGQEQADIAKENEKLVVGKIKASKSNNKKLPPNVRLEDPSTFDPFSMVNVVTMRLFPNKANSDAVKSGRLTAYEALDADEKFKVMAAVPGSPVENTLAVMEISDQAIRFSRNADAPDKGISVWDFDDTLATTRSNVLYTMPDGTKGTLTAEQFAKQGEDLLQEGAEFDFSEFEKVTKGAKGPMFEKAVARNRKFGNDNVFILTARTQAAAEPIYQFLKAIGLDIPLKNIVGLGNSTPEAKARWVVGKAAEGYNDFYFADDAYKNVKAVQDALSVLDVKSKVRQAFVKHSKSEALDKGFNDILEQTTSIASEKEYKKVKAEVAGASLGRVFRGIPYSAQDFVGLLYETLSKGKLGDSQMAWYKTHLLNPYARAVNDIDNARLAVMADYRALKKQLGFVPKNLRKKIPGEPYSREQAVRVYIWNKLGYDVPGISKQDLKDLSEHVADNADLQVFADQVIAIQKGEYAKPKEGWPAGTITTDIQESINTGVRAKYLTQWQNNVDVIFSEKNMNKLEAAYGKKWRKAMENMLGRMKTGRNRNFSDDSLTARFTDWLQGSIGAIMFFNSRSSLLQNLSSINFLNFTDNNPLAAAKAFANQKQYWSDFSKLINSDFLKARRSGLRMNVNEADIADMAKKGGPRAVISKLLQFGFTPTQVADSFAIASGGATFYRNRIKSLMKQGMSQAEAETQAFEDFRETAEESQQSARPDRISMQQAGPLGRLILAFQNTPSQYARIIDKSVRDLKNGRGDRKTNISKIIYYSTVQNLLFNALQQALFAFAFDDEEPEDEEKKDKYISIANGMADSLLRGTGVAGGVMSVTKNAIIRIIRESQKDNPNYEKVGADLQRIAPPVSSKLSKINQAARSFKWDKDEMINGGWGLDNPAYLAVGNVVSATTNIPIDRAVKKINNLTKASDSELEIWERLALFGGWQDWEIGIEEEKKKSQKRKVKKRKVKKRKVKK